MAAKAVSLMLVMTLMVSTFTIEADAFDLADSGRSLLRLRFFTNTVKEQEATPVEVTTTSVPSVEAPSPSGNGEKQTWVSWFNNMFTGSSSSGAPTLAPSA